ncbi:MAG: serine esterase [Verrucomicrobia bacterium]|nr:serine esterase [Verrucomicrobiota bacterium]
MMLDTVFVPASEKNSRRLMVVLHGLGDSVAGYEWMPQAMRLPWMNYLLVNAPDDYFGGYSWYDFEGDAGTGIHRSRQLLFELLDGFRVKGFATEQTVLFGFSQGCLMTLEIGLRYPHRLAGLVGVSGYAHEPETALRELSPVALEQRFLITHGTADPLIPIPKVREQIASLKSAGLKIEWREFAKVHTIAGEEELDVIRKFVCDGFNAN